MKFSIEKSIEILQRTPNVLTTLTQNLSDEWTTVNEGGDTWNVFDVIGHLIHGEQTDWLARTEIILFKENKNFPVFDRFAQFEVSKGKTITQLLHEFEIARTNNLAKLRNYNLTETDLIKTGIHPTFGSVTLSQLLATWVVHDLDHISQVSRIMAKQLKEETGPWIEFLRILRQ